MNEELKQVMSVAEVWTREPFDAETRAQVKAMMEAEDKTELIDAFYRTLEFGTGGLRGIMGPGTNRMNKYIVAMATQGYANYLLKVQKQGGFEHVQNGRVAVVVGHDCPSLSVNSNAKAVSTSPLLTTPKSTTATRLIGRMVRRCSSRMTKELLTKSTK